MSGIELTIEDKAKMEVLENLTNEAAEKGVDPMTIMAMGMQTMMVISEYQKKVEESEGGLGLENLVSAIENGGFTDENGTSISDTITFKQLKNKLIKKVE